MCAQQTALIESISRACESSLNLSAIIYTEEIDFSKSFTTEFKLRYSGKYTDDMLSDLLGREFLLFTNILNVINKESIFVLLF